MADSGARQMEDLDIQCAWCGKTQGSKPSKETGTTHGICPACSKKMLGEGENFRQNAIQVKIDRLRNQLATAGEDAKALLRTRIQTLQNSKSETPASGTAVVEANDAGKLAQKNAIHKRIADAQQKLLGAGHGAKQSIRASIDAMRNELERLQESVNSELEAAQEAIGRFKAETRGRMLDNSEWQTLFALEAKLRTLQGCTMYPEGVVPMMEYNQEDIPKSNRCTWCDGEGVDQDDNECKGCGGSGKKDRKKPPFGPLKESNDKKPNLPRVPVPKPGQIFKSRRNELDRKQKHKGKSFDEGDVTSAAGYAVGKSPMTEDASDDVKSNLKQGLVKKIINGKVWWVSPETTKEGELQHVGYKQTENADDDAFDLHLSQRTGHPPTSEAAGDITRTSNTYFGITEAFGTYEEFAKAYKATYKKMMSYKPSEVGSGIYVEKLAKLADEHPDWAEQVENSLDEAMAPQSRGSVVSGKSNYVKWTKQAEADAKKTKKEDVSGSEGSLFGGPTGSIGESDLGMTAGTAGSSSVANFSSFTEDGARSGMVEDSDESTPGNPIPQKPAMPIEQEYIPYDGKGNKTKTRVPQGPLTKTPTASCQPTQMGCPMCAKMSRSHQRIDSTATW